MRKKLLWALLAVAVLGLFVFVFRIPLLRSVHNSIVYEDSLQKADLIVVLSGGTFDRCNEAMVLYHSHWAPKILCTGGNIPMEMKALDLNLTEADLGRMRLKNHGIPPADIITLPMGSSTHAEADLLLRYCITHKIKSCIVVSNRFHTLRTKRVFKKLLADNGISTTIHGAYSSTYDERFWWKQENGLIATVNEYCKMLVYGLKY
jgi:uncharacterized SAM-binding protein YcdF (DUF218 family)